MAYHENSRKTFPAAGLINSDRLVKLTAEGVAACAAGDQPIGVTELGARMADEPCGVRLLNTPGTVEVLAAADVSVGQELTTAADGAVTPYGDSGPRVGVAVTAAASGGLVEMMPQYAPAPTAAETGGGA